MDKRINKRIEQWSTQFKDEIKQKICALAFIEPTKTNDLIEFVYEYQRLQLTKDDISKRKRVKNTIPVANRCNAKRANDEHYTRRRKDGCEFCGTHIKGIPHGLIDDSTNRLEPVMEKVEVIVQEIGGIVYYIDTKNNVYCTEDIVENKTNPRIVAKYVLSNGVYSIPEFNL
jgi:hypothetical protein